jgi:hypothetical protein
VSETDPSQADEVELWNDEDAQELEYSTDISAYNVLISARDWTVETIVQQIKQGNIDLDPAFQRRNAWRDQRRSRLIESFILGFPVPQIVLAENPRRKKTFVVIDGKQRLMTVAGFYLPEFREYWTQPRFSGLSVLGDLNKITIDNFLASAVYANARRQLANADIRTTVLTGFSNEGVLYDIFYRINSGSVPLSSQELRQVLNRGPFARYLLEVTSQPNPLWEVLRVTAPDPRLRDVELLLRLVAWRTSAKNYTGNMKPFLDETMKSLNESWDKKGDRISIIVAQLLQGIQAGIDVLGDSFGRKYKGGRFERTLNRALFEVQAFYFSYPLVRNAVSKRKKKFLEAFKALSADADFLQSLEATTKSIENYRLRFDGYRDMLNTAINVLPESLALGQGARNTRKK